MDLQDMSNGRAMKKIKPKPSFWPLFIDHIYLDSVNEGHGACTTSLSRYVCDLLSRYDIHFYVFPVSKSVARG